MQSSCKHTCHAVHVSMQSLPLLLEIKLLVLLLFLIMPYLRSSLTSYTALKLSLIASKTFTVIRYGAHEKPAACVLTCFRVKTALNIKAGPSKLCTLGHASRNRFCSFCEVLVLPRYHCLSLTGCLQAAQTAF